MTGVGLVWFEKAVPPPMIADQISPTTMEPVGILMVLVI
jgi:hypothetical protein